MFTIQRQARMTPRCRVVPAASMLVMVLAWSIVAQAQDTLTGKWQGETPNGAVLVLDLAVALRRREPSRTEQAGEAACERASLGGPRPATTLRAP